MTVGAVWTPIDDRILELSSLDAAVHIRTFWRTPTDRAVVIGELTGEGDGLHDLLPEVWQRLSLDVDLHVMRVYSYAPLAADPFRRHDAATDVAGGWVPVSVVAVPGRAPTSHATCTVDDEGPLVDVWRHEDYTRAVVAPNADTSGALRYAPGTAHLSHRSLRPRTGSPDHVLPARSGARRLPYPPQLLSPRTDHR